MENELNDQYNTVAYTWVTDVLQKKNPPWPETNENNHSFEKILLQIAGEHGVLTLCTFLLYNSPSWDTLPETFRHQLKQLVKNETAFELSRLNELRKIIEIFTAADIHPIILKGTALAYSIYDQPASRSRCNTDLLFPDKETAEDAWLLLEKKGYQRPQAVSGEMVSQQFMCYKIGVFGEKHILDIHWQLSNRHFVANLFAFTELRQQAVAIPAIDPSAFTLCPVHALLHACIHRISHEQPDIENRLIWLYDIHLLSCSLSDKQWDTFLQKAIDKSICNICRTGLQQTQTRFATPVPENVFHHLKENEKDEHFTGDMSKPRFRSEIMDFRAISSWKRRLQFLNENLFPTADYILRKYDSSHKWLLPFFYARRIIEGLIKRIKHNYDLK